MAARTSKPKLYRAVRGLSLADGTRVEADETVDEKQLGDAVGWLLECDAIRPVSDSDAAAAAAAHGAADFAAEIADPGNVAESDEAGEDSTAEGSDR